MFNDHEPIYVQLLRGFREKIAGGMWQPGDRIPSVRDLALEFGVNPNTVQRALSELERSELCFSERTSGRFICRDEEKISRLREDLAAETAQSFIVKMRQLGFNREDALRILLQSADRLKQSENGEAKRREESHHESD